MHTLYKFMTDEELKFSKELIRDKSPISPKRDDYFYTISKILKDSSSHIDTSDIELIKNHIDCRFSVSIVDNNIVAKHDISHDSEYRLARTECHRLEKIHDREYGYIFTSSECYKKLKSIEALIIEKATQRKNKKYEEYKAKGFV